MLKIIIYIKKITLFHIFYALTKIETLTFNYFGFFLQNFLKICHLEKLEAIESDFQVMGEALYFFFERER